MGYVVTAAMVCGKDEEGRVHQLYQGTPVHDLLHPEELARLVNLGMIASGDVDPSGDVSRPARVAAKAAWVEFAVAQGASRDDAEGATKDQLIDTYGS